MTDHPISRPEKLFDAAVQHRIRPIGPDDHFETVSGVGLPSDHALHTRDCQAQMVWEGDNDRYLRLRRMRINGSRGLQRASVVAMDQRHSGQSFASRSANE